MRASRPRAAGRRTGDKLCSAPPCVRRAAPCSSLGPLSHDGVVANGRNPCARPVTGHPPVAHPPRRYSWWRDAQGEKDVPVGPAREDCRERPPHDQADPAAWHLATVARRGTAVKPSTRPSVGVYQGKEEESCGFMLRCCARRRWGCARRRRWLSVRRAVVRSGGRRCPFKATLLPRGSRRKTNRSRPTIANK